MAGVGAIGGPGGPNGRGSGGAHPLGQAVAASLASLVWGGSGRVGSLQGFVTGVEPRGPKAPAARSGFVPTSHDVTLDDVTLHDVTLDRRLTGQLGRGLARP